MEFPIDERCAPSKYMTARHMEEIIGLCRDWEFEQAKARIQNLCKTKPEKQAYRLARIVGALCDPDGFHKERGPSLAVKLLAQFDNPIEYGE